MKPDNAIKGNIFDIQKFSSIDGPGVRTTVFFKGCNLSCAWCHNPESQSPHAEMMFYKGKCTGCGKCVSVCPNGQSECTLCGKCTIYCPARAKEVVGRGYSLDELFEEIDGDRAFYDVSGGGVTFSGGECMLQIDFLCEILKKCKENGISTAVDTAGHLPFEYFERVMPFCDLFLYDVKCFDRDRHKEYVGVYNDLILSNLEKLLKADAPLWVRVPIIPTVNDSTEEIKQIKDFIYSNGRPQKVELLAYHSMGEYKYDALGMKKQSFSVPSEEKMRELRGIFD